MSAIRRTLTAWPVAAALAAACLAPHPACAAGILDQPPVPDGTIALQTGEGTLYSAAIDRLRGYGYFVSDSTLQGVVKVRLERPGVTAARVGALAFPGSSNDGDCIAVDEANGIIYLASGDEPARVYKIAAGDGDAPMTLIGEITLETGEIRGDAVVYDPVGNHLYVGTDSAPGRIVKVDCGAPASPPVRLSALTLTLSESDFRGAALDPAARKAWFHSSNSDAAIVQISLTPGSDPPIFDGAVTLQGLGGYKMDYDPLSRTLIANVYNIFSSQPMLAKLGTTGPLPNLISQHFPADANSINPEGFARDTINGVVYQASGSGGHLTRTATGASPFAGFGALDVTDPAAPPIDLASVIVDPAFGRIYAGGNNLEEVRIYRQPRGTGPDLSGTWTKFRVTGKPGKERARGRLAISDETGAGTGLFLVQFFLSDDEVLSHDDVQVGKTVLVKALKPGKVRNVGFNSGPQPSLTGKSIIAVIDPQNLTDDANRANNRIVALMLTAP